MWGKKRVAYRDLVWKLEERRPLGRPRSRWGGNVKKNIQEVGWGSWTGLIWLRIGTAGGHL